MRTPLYSTPLDQNIPGNKIKPCVWSVSQLGHSTAPIFIFISKHAGDGFKDNLKPNCPSVKVFQIPFKISTRFLKSKSANRCFPDICRLMSNGGSLLAALYRAAAAANRAGDTSPIQTNCGQSRATEYWQLGHNTALPLHSDYCL